MSLDLDKCIEQLYDGKVLQKNQIKTLCEMAKKHFLTEPNVLKLSTPLTICGDIHGQFYDLIELFNISGKLPNVNYLFLGDYVDRGYFSLQVISLLICLKMKYKNRLYLIRGNHESKQITLVYGFYDECIKKYGDETVWKMFIDLFNHLPLAAVIDKNIFCVHGGLSPSVDKIDEINSLERFEEVPVDGAICDLLWSDPDDEQEGWGMSPRGVGYIFGSDITKEFVYKNGVDFVARAHQLVDNGFEWQHEKSILTLFSAPNYCYRCGNLAAVMQVDEKLSINFIQFDPAPRNDMTNYKKVSPEYFL